MGKRKSKLIIVMMVLIACLVSTFEIPTYALTVDYDNAVELKFNSTVTGHYAGKGSQDVYKIVLKKSGRLTITYNSNDSQTLMLGVWNEDKKENSHFYIDNHRLLKNSVYEDAGTYYLVISEGRNIADYSLKCEFEEVNETYPESYSNKDNSMSQARKISFNKLITGILACEYSLTNVEKDFFTFSLNGKADFNITSKTNSGACGLYNILDSNGNVVETWSDDYDSKLGYARCKSKKITLNKGVYYLSVELNMDNEHFEYFRTHMYEGFIYKLSLNTNIAISRISMNKSALLIDMENTKTAQLKATVSPSYATNKKIKWTSSNTNVAKVSSDGKVTAVGSGTATIYAKAIDGSGKKASCKVTVKAAPGVTYSTHVQSYGWQNWRSNGAMAGTAGEAKRLEGIKISLKDKRYSGGIRYTTHVQTYGWLGNQSNSATWAHDGQMSGTTGQGKRLEAIKIKLYGDMAKNYDVYYRVHTQSYGWLGWAKNGAPSGTAGKGKRLEAIQIVLVKKGGKAPSNTYKGIVSNTSAAYIQ